MKLKSDSIFIKKSEYDATVSLLNLDMSRHIDVLFVGDRPANNMHSDAPAFRNAKCESRLYDWIRNHLEVRYFYIINSDDGPLLRFWLHVAEHFNFSVVALGNNASKRIGKNYSHFKLPHPSGRNRKLNDQKFVAEELRKCKEWIDLTIITQSVKHLYIK